MKTKTTITVETYKLSAVRLRQDLSSTVCPSCGRNFSTGDASAISAGQTATSGSTLKGLKENSNEERKFIS